MALMTTAEVKSVLGITAATYDTQIAFFLPYVERDIISYLNNRFHDGYVYRESASEFAFAPDTGGDYVTDGDTLFSIKGFTDGMDVFVLGGGANEGLYHISSA